MQFVDVDTIMSVDGNELEQCMYVYLMELERVWNEAQESAPALQVDSRGCRYSERCCRRICSRIWKGR